MSESKPPRGKVGRPRKDTGKHFHLAKSLRENIRACAEHAAFKQEPRVIYLWAAVSGRGLETCKGAGAGQEPLGKAQWLNIVDEAASLGANWLILSIRKPLGDCCELWDVCGWAQGTHEMKVGLHLDAGAEAFTPADVAVIKRRLVPERTWVLARRESLPALQWIEGEGLSLWASNPQQESGRPQCQGPARMIFVDSKGVLYTCGLVQGNHEYRMGHVFERMLKDIVQDPTLPHRVHEAAHYLSPDCDGCPALIANFFPMNAE